MLALRNVVCNDRWQEMWQKALHHHRKLQALQRKVRAEHRVPSLLEVGHSPSSSSPSQPATASQEISPPVPVRTPPSSSHPSTRRKRQTARNRVNASHHRSSEASRDTCLCGTPLVRFGRHRPKRYCSDRCRMRAHRKRQAQAKRLSAPLAQGPATPLPGSSHAPHQRTWRAKPETKRISLKVRGDMCLCGTKLLQSPGGRMREYCSGRCHQRAYRERQEQAS